jgi:hypothetical protein
MEALKASLAKGGRSDTDKPTKGAMKEASASKRKVG